MINTKLMHLRTTWLPVFAPEDGTGTGDGGPTVTEGDGNGDANAGGKPAGEGTALGDHEPAGGAPDDGDGSGDGTNTDDGKTALEGDGKADEAGDGDGKGDGEADPLDVVPDDGNYKFNVPDGMTLEDGQSEFWNGKFAEAKLTQRQVDAIVDAQIEQRTTADKSFLDGVETREKTQLAEAKADADIGGDNWKASLGHVTSAFTQMGGDSVIKDLLIQGGHGNNPEVIRELRNIGKHFAQDTFDGASPKTGAVTAEKSWYGETTPETKKG